MKKSFLREIINSVALATAITTLLSLGVSAQWRQTYNKSWIYTNGNTIVRGWSNISGTWYYFDINGEMKTGWTYYKDNWYYLSNSGAMQKGWANINNVWYYLDNTGSMKTGWIKDNEKWYYLDSSGAMQTGTINIGDKIYYLSKSGYLQKILTGQNQSSKESTSVTTNSTTVDVNGLTKLPENYTINVQGFAENTILKLMNKKRTEAGLKPLTLDNTLIKIARYKSNHMIQYNYFDHTTPQGNNWTSWLASIGYHYNTTGENIAYNNYDPVELFNQWWNSSGHRANMMNPNYTKIGIGVIYGNTKYMGTQTFSK